MEASIHSISSNISNIRQDIFPLDEWTITTRKGIIIQSKCTCQQSKQNEPDDDPQNLCNICNYYKLLPQLHNMPDMLFNNNLLRLEHYTGVGIEFNALDALKMVKKTDDPLQVAVAGGWQSARAEFPFAKSVAKPFDWTFTTNYRGTLLSAKQKKHPMRRLHSQSETSSDTPCSVDCHLGERSDKSQSVTGIQMLVEETEERIDINKLKVKEEILFYDDITLYEDELADHGIAQYSVKIRVMPKSLFILARYYLRIDGVLARINDTRVYYEFKKKYLSREYTNREAKISSLNLPVSTLINPNELMFHLPITNSCYEELSLPECVKVSEDK